MNIAIGPLDKVARTHREVAQQRAERLKSLNVKRVLELCVGPSLRVLEEEYKKVGITCIGNDIDSRWFEYYPKGTWLSADAVSDKPLYCNVDAYVFAPPLSRGCSGRREDSLQIDQITPKYTDFVDKYTGFLLVLVLPARALATREDRTQLYKLISFCSIRNYTVSIKEVCVGRRQIRKYVELYLKRI